MGGFLSYCKKAVCPEVTRTVCPITEGGERAQCLPWKPGASRGLSPANLSLGTVRALQPVLTARPTLSPTSQGEGRVQPALHADAAHRRVFLL